MSTFKKHKQQRINATATPAAMKGSARTGTVIAAPVNAEERLLKVCASVADKNNCASPSCAALDRALILIHPYYKIQSPVRSRLWMNVHNPH
jgi:hypothetical protein